MVIIYSFISVIFIGIILFCKKKINRLQNEIVKIKDENNRIRKISVDLMRLDINSRYMRSIWNARAAMVRAMINSQAFKEYVFRQRDQGKESRYDPIDIIGFIRWKNLLEDAERKCRKKADEYKILGT